MRTTRHLKWITLALIMLFPIIHHAQTVSLPDMVLVQGGTFKMGCDTGCFDEAPVHQVTLGDYYIGKFEVTFAEFRRFVLATGYITDAEKPDTVNLKNGLPPKNLSNGSWKTYPSGSPVADSDTNKPVGNVSWNDAMAYCQWLSKVTGKNFSLPTEAEWEFAARGGALSKGYAYSGSNNLEEVAWYFKNSSLKVHGCGQKMANELGIYDMSGNMREWCADWYSDYYYRQSPRYSPMGPERGTLKIIRGGAWGTHTRKMRLTYRNNMYAYNSQVDMGFRLAIPGKPVEAPKPAPPKSEFQKALDEKGMVDIYGIYFDSGKSVVKPESFPVIEQIVTYLNENPKVRFLIEGHTDNTGKEAMNLSLSEKRAESIKAEVVKKGIDPARLECKGFGSTIPIADNKTAAGRTQNRRVTIKKL